MSKKEQQRVAVLNEVDRGMMTGRQAAEAMGVSLRQMRRLASGYRRNGVAALAHGNRGRKPPNAIVEELRRRVVALAAGEYAGFNQQHLQEMLV